MKGVGILLAIIAQFLCLIGASALYGWGAGIFVLIAILANACSWIECYVGVYVCTITYYNVFVDGYKRANGYIFAYFGIGVYV